MGKLAIYVKSPNGAVNYLCTAEEVVLEEKNEGSLHHPRYRRSLTLAGEDLGPLSPQKLRRVEVVSAYGGIYGKRMSGVIDDVGTLLLIDAGRVRATYDNTAQFASRHKDYRIQLIDV